VNYSIDLLPERLRSKIEIVGECWIWRGYVLRSGTRQGYGRASFRGYGGPEVWLVHRITHTLLVGPLTPGKDLDHLIESGVCTDTRCCNPGHTEEVTRGENLRRSPTTIPGKHSRKSVCPRGHVYSGVDSNGGRRCNICHALTEAKRRERRRAA
jgi:hypothetical protein